MPEPVAEPALNGLRLNLRIVSVVIFNFASYLTIGLPLAVLPGYSISRLIPRGCLESIAKSSGDASKSNTTALVVSQRTT